MAMVGVDSGSQPTGVGLLRAQVVCLGLTVGVRLASFYIHQMNRVNSRNGSVMMTAP